MPWMAKAAPSHRTIKINRAPVLTLWAAVVAQRVGFDWDEALTLGRAVAGLNAYAKGVSLGLFTPASKSVKEQKKKLKADETFHVELLHRAVPVIKTPDGLRAASKSNPIKPESVTRYLESAFGDALDDVKGAMERLAHSMPPGRLTGEGFRLYEKFRPQVPAGVGGWGAKGVLDVKQIIALAN
jgi:hypothetical protein